MATFIAVIPIINVVHKHLTATFWTVSGPLQFSWIKKISVNRIRHAINFINSVLKRRDCSILANITLSEPFDLLKKISLLYIQPIIFMKKSLILI